MRQPSTARTARARDGFVKTTWLWLVLGLGLLAIYLGSFTVKAGEYAIVARFGDPRRLIEEPGLHFKWPAPIDALFRIDMRTNVLDPEIEEFLTDDQRNVDVDAFIAWRVADPQQFLKSLRDRESAETKIGEVLQSALLEVLKSGPFDDLVSLEVNRERNLADVSADVTRKVRQLCLDNGYGVEIQMAGIERINFPYDNRSEVEAAMRSTRIKEARGFTAEGRVAAGMINSLARKEAATLTATAEADAAAIVGKAVAKANGLRLASRDLNPELFDIVARHEVAQQALRGANVIFPYDFWLVRVFDDPSKDAASPKGSEGEGQPGDDQ
ncbi:MAG: membrane protease subunit HflC [Planctomycetota bacterium]|jgi:membrane protease subunit HflC